MSGESPDSVLYSSDGTELNVVSGSAIPTGTRGILTAGTDGTNARFLSVNSSGQLITVGNITQFGGVNLSTGTGASGTGIPRVTVSNDSNILATQSGSWSVTALSATAANLLATVTQGPPNTLANAWSIKLTDGTNTMPTGDVAARAVYHRITDGTNTLGTSSNPLVVQAGTGGYAGQVEGRAAAGASNVGNPVYMGGTDGTNARGILTDTSGRIIVAPAGTASTTAGFAAGHINTAATTIAAVRGTTYTEQSSNAQRSIVSSNAADTAAGTGARTVTITYYTSTGTGPFTEVVTLNGTTAVNTVSTTICYIEDIVVSSVGSGNSNAGTISLKATTAGGGATVWSIAIGDNQTFGAHHYTATGKSTYVTGMSLGHNGTTAGSGALFVLKSIPIGVANSVETVVSDELRLYGQSSTITRTYGTAIKITGPARSTIYVTPETATSTIYRAAFDLYDQ